MKNLPVAVFSVWGEQLEDCPPLSFFPDIQALEDKRGHQRSHDGKTKNKKEKNRKVAVTDEQSEALPAVSKAAAQKDQSIMEAAPAEEQPEASDNGLLSTLGDKTCSGAEWVPHA